MTAILATRVSGGILIGSDRAWDDEDQMLTCGPKAIRVGEWIVACAGYVVADWESLRKESPRTATELGVLLGRKSSASAIAVRGNVIRLGECSCDAWSWGVVRGDVAVGSGASWVRGAWDALRGYESDPEKRMRAALRVAAKRCPSVRGPFDVIWC